MDIHSASQARANLFKLLEQVNQESEPCIITSRKGDGVLISKDDWERWFLFGRIIGSKCDSLLQKIFNNISIYLHITIINNCKMFF